MPIIYMHGVNARDPKHFEPVREYLHRIVAPVIARYPDNLSIRPADWLRPPTLGERNHQPAVLR